MNMRPNELIPNRWRMPFSPEFLECPSSPVAVGLFKIDDVKIPRWNHYLIKERGTDSILPIPPILTKFVHLCLSWLSHHDFSIRDRWAYLTVDTKPVEPGMTQRQPGWHIDGMQGDEVPVKQFPDLTFIWSDVLPTQYFLSPISMKGFNGSRHNIHRWAQDAVHGKPEHVIIPDDQFVRLIDPYVIHRGSVNNTTDVMPRIFLRMSLTKTPITSRKMTLNPDARYDYPIHVTSGDVPSYLI